ncbi:MAG: Hsp20/alpha crystallin family protein [Bacteroidota bacterium]
MLVRVHRLPTPASSIDTLFGFEKEIDNLFGDLLNKHVVVPAKRSYPALDMVEQENETVVVAELPGVRKEDVKVSVHDGVLTISGERKAHQLPEKSVSVRSEISIGKFSRSVQLPHEVQNDGISAELTNGVLRIVLPKAEEARPREIQVR